MCLFTSVQADSQTVDITFEEQGAAITLGFAAARAGHAPQVDTEEVPQHVLHSIQSGLATGFQLATAAGPLCDEPMWGIAFEVRQTLLNCELSPERVNLVWLFLLSLPRKSRVALAWACSANPVLFSALLSLIP